MKKNDVILLIAVLAYSFLFFEQIAGINFLLFNMLLVSLLLWKDKGLIKNKNWCMIAAGSLVTATFVFIHGNTLCFIANCISLLLLSAMSMSRNSSIFLGLLYSLYSTIASISFMVIDILEKKKQKKESRKNVFWQRSLLIAIGFLIILVLFFLYRESNPLFKDFTKNINLDFISFSWIRFTLLGLILLYGFFYHRNFQVLYKYDTTVSNKLSPEISENKEVKGLRKFLTTDVELKTGVVLLILLNLLIIFVNALDITYLWAGSGLPKDMNYSESVHQGVGTLIFSILIAISIILFFFRAELNFIKGNKTIKLFAILWIIQNAMMVISTIYRNYLYIDGFGLTYKRIGVYAYLFLAVLGLLSTFIKIASNRSNWYLFRFNGWTFYIVLIIASMFNWDRYITNYNLSYAKTLDTEYLLKLSDANIPELLVYDNDKKLKGFLSSTVLSYETQEDLRAGNYSYPKSYQNILHSKLFQFMKMYEEYGWKSWCIDRQNLHQIILKIENEGKLTSLDLSASKITTLAPIKAFTHLKFLDLSSNTLENISEIKSFSLLEKLNLSSNKLSSVDSLSKLEYLKELKLSANTIYDFKALKGLANLELLDISYNNYINFESLPVLEKLYYLDISGDIIKDYAPLAKQKSLHTLIINAAGNRNISTIPALPELIGLSIISNNINPEDAVFMQKLSFCSKLGELNISKNNLTSLADFDKENIHTDKSEASPLFPVLITLDISNNKIADLNGIKNFPALENLQISSNNLTDISMLSELSSLQKLNLKNNQIRNISALKFLPQLTMLNISGNPVGNSDVIKCLKNLDTLIVSNTGITNVSSLSGLTNLTSLDLSGNLIGDIKPLQKLTNLKSLNLTGTDFTDFSSLKSFTSLKELFISGITPEKLDELKLLIPNTKIYVIN